MDIYYSNYYRLFSMVTNADMINQHILMYKFLQYLQNHYKVGDTDFSTFSTVENGLKVKIRIVLQHHTFSRQINQAVKIIAFFLGTTTFCTHCKAISLESRGIQ
jgi:hypothetical protein